jgi:hypothetical protein
MQSMFFPIEALAHKDSNMIPQLQFQRVGIQVMLAPQIGLVIFAHIMVDQGERDNERDMALVIMFDNFEQFQLFIPGKVFLEIAHQMLQDIGMLLYGCAQLQRLHQLDLIRSKRIRL